MGKVSGGGINVLGAKSVQGLLTKEVVSFLKAVRSLAPPPMARYTPPLLSDATQRKQLNFGLKNSYNASSNHLTFLACLSIIGHGA